MILWIVLTVLTSLAVAGLTVPLVRRHDLGSERETNIAILKRQLGEIDAQESAGSLARDEAEGMRTEIKRRILAEGRVNEGTARTLDQRSVPWVAIAIAGVVALAATGLYALMGRPDLPAAHTVAANPQEANETGHPIADVSTMIAQLEAKLRTNPSDPEGWRMLGWSYSAVGRSGDAAEAYARAAVLNPKNADYPSAEGDALVGAAQGTGDARRAGGVPGGAQDRSGRSARALLHGALRRSAGQARSGDGGLDRADQKRAAGCGMGETGARFRRTRGARAPYRHRRQASACDRLPQRPRWISRRQPGPTPDQVQAASQMPAGDREAMIRTMVDKLAGELKTNPHDADGWMRLMRARMVLGETDKAAAAYHDAKVAFANSPNDLDALQKAAQSLGIPGA